jgi:quercetin dioxygenase-like cupin family protein
MQFRRVVTGHDTDGRAVVTIDETSEVALRETGFGGRVFWTTEGFPVDNGGDADAGARQVPIALPNGTIFRVVVFGPGNQGRRHRTETIDYAVVISGEIDMELDGDTVVHLRAGDVLVQRGTVHNWLNRGTEPCAIAFILIDARPVEVAGKLLRAEG